MKFDINSSRSQTLIFFGLIGIALVWVFRRYLFFQELFIFTDIGSDTMTLFYPSMLEGTRAFKSEGIQLWSFAIGIGQGAYSSVVLNPFSWLRYIVGPENLAYGIAWFQFIKIALISIASFYYLRIMKLDKYTVYLGVILCTFLGYVMIGACWYGHLSILLYSFLFLLSFEMILMKGKWWLMPILVIFFLGPKLYFFTEFAIIYVILRLSLMNLLSWKNVVKTIPRFLGPALLGLLLCAPFLGSVFYKFLYSPRVGGGVSYTSDLMAASPFRLETMRHYGTVIYRFFSNDILGTGDAFKGWNNYMEAPIFYAGILSLLLMPQLFRFLNKKQLVVCSSILFLWAIVIIFPYFRNAFYLFVGNYYKSALSFFIPFTILFFGLIAFYKIIQSKRVNLYVLGITFILLLVLLFSPVEILKDKVDEQVRWWVVLFLISHTVLLVFYHFARNKTLAIYLILAVALLEGALMANKTINDRDTISTQEFEARTYHNDYTLEAVNYIHANDEPFYRIEKTFGSVLSGYNDSQSQNFFGTRSYRSHNHNNYIRFLESMNIIKPNDEVYTRWVVGLQKIPQLHPLFSLKYMISNQEKKDLINPTLYENLGDLNGLTIYKNRFYLPLGIAIPNVVSQSDFAKVSDYYRKIELLYNAVIVEDNELSKFPRLKRFNTSRLSGGLNYSSFHKKLSGSAMKMESFTQSRIKGSVELDQPSMVFFSFPFDAGWSAKVDGKNSELVKINNGLTGLYLPAGDYKIDLKYRPPFFILGWIIFFLGLGLYIYFLRWYKKQNTVPIGEEATPTLVGLTSKSKGKSQTSLSAKNIKSSRSSKKGKYRKRKR